MLVIGAGERLGRFRRGLGGSGGVGSFRDHRVRNGNGLVIGFGAAAGEAVLLSEGPRFSAIFQVRGSLNDARGDSLIVLAKESAFFAFGPGFEGEFAESVEFGPLFSGGFSGAEGLGFAAFLVRGGAGRLGDALGRERLDREAAHFRQRLGRGSAEDGFVGENSLLGGFLGGWEEAVVGLGIVWQFRADGQEDGGSTAAEDEKDRQDSGLHSLHDIKSKAFGKNAFARRAAGAKTGSMVNLSTTMPLALDLAPIEVTAGLRHCRGLVFLDSVTSGPGQISIVGIEPEQVLEGEDWDILERELGQRARVTSDHGRPEGAAIGNVTYEGRYCLGFYDRLLVFDHGRQQWFGDAGLLEKWASPAVAVPSEPLRFTSATSGAEYCRQVAEAKEWIAQGDIYQVNITHEFTAKWAGDGFALFEALRHYSPAPFSAYLDLGGREIISSSPELFLKMSGRQVVTRPIKGTRPRAGDQERDELAAYELLTSPKEVAELVMITDLERNDLGQICEYGSVRVTELLKLERYEQVFHLVSTVEGQLRSEVSHVAALAACFPGGSITGAPKKRAREIIWELEGRKRGVYTGAIGYFGYNGESQFSIAIRTLCAQDGEVSFAVGAGIVADSDPAREYQETLDKAAGIFLAAERLAEMTRDQG